MAPCRSSRRDIGSPSFPEATQLAQEADVRIAGVRVGRVKKKEADEATGLTEAEIEIDARYAPLPEDTNAILRQKTLLGETYVELAPGEGAGGNVPDGGRLGQARVADTVQLDEILRAFDPETRERFSVWLDQQGRAVADNGAEINAALANLTPFAEETGDVLEVLNRQSGFTRGLIRDTGVVFEALTERQGQLRDLVVNSNRLWETTARRDAELADTFRVLPTFLREGRETTRRLTRFADNTNPLVDQLRPAAREISPTLIDLKALAPDLRGFFTDLDPLVRTARRGLPATEQVLDNTRPILARLDPFLRQVTPIIDYLGLYKREIAAFFANDSAASQATGTDFAGPARSTTCAPSTPPTRRCSRRIRTGSPRTARTRTRSRAATTSCAPRATSRCSAATLHSNPVPAPPAPRGTLAACRPRQLIQRFVYGGPRTPVRAAPCDPRRRSGGCRGPGGRYPHLQPLP